MIYFRETDVKDVKWIELAQDKPQCRNSISTGTTNRVPWKQGIH
jgi:hypothetical protein